MFHPDGLIPPNIPWTTGLIEVVFFTWFVTHPLVKIFIAGIKNIHFFKTYIISHASNLLTCKSPWKEKLF